MGTKTISSSLYTQIVSDYHIASKSKSFETFEKPGDLHHLQKDNGELRPPIDIGKWLHEARLYIFFRGTLPSKQSGRPAESGI